MGREREREGERKEDSSSVRRERERQTDRQTETETCTSKRDRVHGSFNSLKPLIPQLLCVCTKCSKYPNKHTVMCVN